MQFSFFAFFFFFTWVTVEEIYIIFCLELETFTVFIFIIYSLVTFWKKKQCSTTIWGWECNLEMEEKENRITEESLFVSLGLEKSSEFRN